MACSFKARHKSACHTCGACLPVGMQVGAKEKARRSGPLLTIDPTGRIDGLPNCKARREAACCTRGAAAPEPGPRTRVLQVDAEAGAHARLAACEGATEAERSALADLLRVTDRHGGLA